jgi:16S rRNA (guanine966-N2)-methyltransferase
VREALFGSLEAREAIGGARVLDLYSGTGALSIEALSRGADHATLVESSRAALSALRANLAALDLEGRTLVLATDVGRSAARLAALADRHPFDLVLADPPWNLVDSAEATRAIAEVIVAVTLSQAALVVLEHSARSPSPSIHGLALDDTRRYGDTALSIYKPAILGASGPPIASTAPE